MMSQAQRRAFVASHRTCIVGFQRKKGPPSMSVAYYVVDGDDLLISTMAARAKAKAVGRTREAAVCVLDEQWPPCSMALLNGWRGASEDQQPLKTGLRFSTNDRVPSAASAVLAVMVPATAS